MDQIFDRLERLFKSWVAEDDSSARGGHESGGYRSSGNSDLDAAMSELDDFLDTSRTETEKLERERQRREHEAREREARARAQASGQGSRPSGPPRRLVEAYATLGIPYGAPFSEVKAAYKRLLMKHHPDRNTGNPEQHKKATELSARINAAYQLLETWSTTGKLPEE